MIESDALAALPGIRHGFFGRKGGVSTGLYAGLNCGFGSGDDPARVRENRSRAAALLGLGEPQLLSVYQIHSADAVHVTQGWTRETQPKADAMATDRPGFGLGVLAADCAPVLFADARARVIGAAHAGWKGAFDGVLETTLALMERLGARRERVVAAIGPCIGAANYEVGPEFRARFVSADPDNARFFEPAARAGHAMFDLPGYAAERLRMAGVGRIDELGICTYAAPEAYYSFRRATHRSEPDYGRNLSAIALSEPA